MPRISTDVLKLKQSVQGTVSSRESKSLGRFSVVAALSWMQRDSCFGRGDHPCRGGVDLPLTRVRGQGRARGDRVRRGPERVEADQSH